MADFFGELLFGLFQAATEGMFAETRSRCGCLFSLTALVAIVAAVVLLVSAFIWHDTPAQNPLLGLGCLAGIVFLVLGIVALIVKGREQNR